MEKGKVDGLREGGLTGKGLAGRWYRQTQKGKEQFEPPGVTSNVWYTGGWVGGVEFASGRRCSREGLENHWIQSGGSKDEGPSR